MARPSPGAAAWLLAALAASVPAASALVPTAPLPPASVTAEATPGGVLIAWQPPLHDGGSQVASYTVHRLDGLGPWQALATLDADARSFLDAGASGPALYAVSAANGEGSGPRSAPAAPRCDPVGVSGMPPRVHVNTDCIGPPGAEE